MNHQRHRFVYIIITCFKCVSNKEDIIKELNFIDIIKEFIISYLFKNFSKALLYTILITNILNISINIYP